MRDCNMCPGPGFDPTEQTGPVYIGGVLGIDVNGVRQPIDDEGIVHLEASTQEAIEAAERAAQSAAAASTYAQDAETYCGGAENAAIVAAHSQSIAMREAQSAERSATQAAGSATAAAESAAAAQTAAERDIPAAAAAWLSEHVDPATGYVLDDSLTIQGAAADAKAAGDRISPLETGRYALSAADAASIPSGTDYDTLKTVGNYRVTSATAAASMQNCPVAVAHRLFVESLNTSPRYLQRIIAAAATVPEWRRYWDGTTWSQWRRVAYDDTIPSAVIQWNSVDVFANNTAADRTAAGITYTNNHDGTWTISGTATGASFCNIVGNTTVIPTGIVPGRSYRLSLNGGSVPVRFYLYNGEAYTIINAASDRSIKIPDNCTGMIARFQIAAGQTVDETVRYTLITEAERAVDSNGWLESVDMSTQDEYDKTDRAPEIMAMLQEDGYCHLGPGIFYVSGIDMPIHSTLCGCGDATQIRLLASVTDGYCIKAQEYCTIKDLGLSGSYSQLSPTANGHRDGIRFASNYDGTEGDTQSTTKHCMIDNVWIRNFRGSGILCHNSAISVSRGLYVTNAYIFQCWAGINIDYRSEFNKFANVCAASCYYACINNGGNNVFSACTFHATNTGFVIDGTQPNSGHGTITGCTFCHTGSNNGVAIKLDNVADGFVIANCQVWYNSVEITNSTGILFDGCEFGRGISSDGSVCASITVTGGRLVLFSGCMFHMDVARPPKITITSNNKVRFAGCYGTESGELISA